MQLYVNLNALPFYSEKVVFSSCIFVISFIYILTQNLITYKRYGIFHQNEFYTVPYETLKTLHLFFCVLGGILFCIAIFSFFYVLQVTAAMNISCSANTSILTLISLFLLAIEYIFYGKKVGRL